MGSVWSARPAAKMKNEIDHNLLPGRVGFRRRFPHLVE